MWDLSLGFEKPIGLGNFFYKGKPIAKPVTIATPALVKKGRPPKRAP
jgi:hypothetical protein